MPRSATSRVRSFAAALCLALGVGLLVVVAAPPSTLPSAQAAESYALPSDGVFRLSGHGYGHGRGLSQYGSLGAAQSGLSSTQILDFYYANTQTAVLSPRYMRVLLTADDDDDVTVLPADGMAVFDDATSTRQQLPPGPTRWRIVALSSGRLQVQAAVPGQGWTGFAVGGQSTLAGPVRFVGAPVIKLVLPSGTVRGYRTDVMARATGGSSLETINTLDFEDYLRGVVPRESPSSWPAAALQAQSVAARSYAEYKRYRASGSYDICDTTACQVYGGAALYNADGTLQSMLETASTDAAIAATSRQVRTYAGQAILAEFSSSNGGWTAAGTVPYMIAQQDPYDGVTGSAANSWEAALPASALQAAFPAVGRVTGLTITQRTGTGDWGGRVTSLVLTGVDGAGRATSVTTTGNGIRAALPYPSPPTGVRSNWFTVQGQPTGDPVGSVDQVGPTRGYDGVVTVAGWTTDPDAPSSPTGVHVYVDGALRTAVTADQDRPDLAVARPGGGAAHGFSTTVQLSPGDHQVCVFAINLGPLGSNTLLLCTAVTVLDGSPVGRIEDVGPRRTTDGRVVVNGWAVDPNAPGQSLAVHVYVDGALTATGQADVRRDDVAAAYPGYGALHGLTVPLTLSRGEHQVCVFALNVGGGSNKLLLCQAVSVVDADPLGTVDSIAPAVSTDGRVTVTGWAFDADAPQQPLEIHVYVNGRGYGAFSAPVSRPDVAAAYPGTGPAQGFALPVTLAQGDSQVCVFAINVGRGANRLLKCQAVRVSDRAPVGSVDVVAAIGPGTARVAGWALDRDTPQTAAPVHVYVDGVGYGAFTADAPRPDIGAAFPGAGNAHGFDVPLTLSAGEHTVCAFTLSTSGLAAPLLMRCATVRVA